MTTLSPTGVNLLKPRPNPNLVNPPKPTPVGAVPQPLDGNVAPPGSPLPVGNGIPPAGPPPEWFAGRDAQERAHPGSTAPAPPPTPTPMPAVPDYAPTGLNFGAGNDLRSSVIQPGADPRLAAAQARTDTSVNAVGGVDRRQAAQDILAQYDKAAVDPNREEYRQVGQYASSLGRLGMGQTAQDVQEVGRKHLTDRATLATQLASQTADQEAQDRFARANLSRGVEGDIYGYGAGNRSELRGERGYQFGAAETATDRAVQQAQLEESIRSGQFARGTTLTEMGYSGNPAGVQLGQANLDQAQSGADIGSIAELLKRYGYNSATKAAA